MSDTRPNLVPGGPLQDQEEGVQTDDFGLGGDMKQQLLSALEQRWNPDDPGATTLEDAPDDSADTAATPVPAPDTSDDGTQEPESEDGGGGERAAEGEAAIPAETPPATDDFNAGDYFNEFFGTPLNREQSAELARMISGLQHLTPEQRAELDRTLAGGQPGVYPATQGTPMQPQVNPQVAPQPVDDPAIAILGPRPDDEYMAQQWDMNARLARAQHQETAAIRADIARNTEMEMQRQRAADSAKIDQAAAEWRAQYPMLSDAEFDAVSDRAYRSGAFPALVAAHQNDVAAATRAIYEQNFWSDPALRERAIANIQSGRVAGDPATPDPASAIAQEQATVAQGRQALASSVAGGGGSVTPTGETVPTDPDKRKQAMAQAIAAQHDFT